MVPCRVAQQGGILIESLGMKKRVASALLCLLFATVVSAQQEPQVGVRAREAAHVVVATVVDITSRYGRNASGDQLIYSDVVAEVSETLKGAPTNIVIVTVEGGEVGDVSLHVSDLPVMHKGERILLLPRSRGQWTVGAASTRPRHRQSRDHGAPRSRFDDSWRGAGANPKRARPLVTRAPRRRNLEGHFRVIACEQSAVFCCPPSSLPHSCPW